MSMPLWPFFWLSFAMVLAVMANAVPKEDRTGRGGLLVGGLLCLGAAGFTSAWLYG